MPSESSQTNSDTFRVLSLDGGGIRGAFTAAFLAELERHLELPLSRYFDLIAGTSTGAIIAAALALEEPAAKVERLYLERGKQIFTRAAGVPVRWWLAVAFRILKWRRPNLPLDEAWLLHAKYDSESLRHALTDTFGEVLVEAAKRRLLVPAVDLTQGSPVVFKTPHYPGLVRDRAFRLVDVVLASAAAPSYFPHATIGEGSAYCDGGLWANNPAVSAYAEAVRILERTDDKRSDIRMLSVGTGTHPYFANPPGKSAGLFWWGPRLLDVVGGTHSQAVNNQCQYLLGDGYTRITFDIPDGDEWKLDSVSVVNELVHLGREKAVQQLERLRDTFFQEEAPPPTWF